MLVSDRQCRIRGLSTKIPETVTRNGALLKIHRFCDTCVLFFNIQYHTLCQYNLAEDLTCCTPVIKNRPVKCPGVLKSQSIRSIIPSILRPLNDGHEIKNQIKHTENHYSSSKSLLHRFPITLRPQPLLKPHHIRHHISKLIDISPKAIIPKPIKHLAHQIRRQVMNQPSHKIIRPRYLVACDILEDSVLIVPREGFRGQGEGTT